VGFVLFAQEQAAFLAAHHGVATRAELLDLGVSRGQIDRLVRSGMLLRLHPATYRLSTSPMTWRSQLRAAVVSTGGLASHRAAARLWGIEEVGPAPIEVVIAESTRRLRPDVEVHFSKQMHLVDPHVIDGIPVTDPARTVLDLFAVLGHRRRIQALDAFLREELVHIHDVFNVVVRHSIQGRTGVGRLRRVLDEGYTAAAIPDSRWNRMVGQLLEDAGLPTPKYEHEVFGPTSAFVARVDLAFPRRRLAIELDSRRWHDNSTSFREDPRRRNRLQLAGWQVLSFTWADYADTPVALIGAVRSALQQRPFF